MTNKLFPYTAFFYLMGRNKFKFSTEGKCYRVTKANELIRASRPNRNGYYRIPFCFEGQRFEIMEHIAFWVYCTGRWPRNGQQINHKDMNRGNNAMSNLELVTQSQNIRHRIAMRKQLREAA